MEAILEKTIRRLDTVIDEAMKGLTNEGTAPDMKVDLANLICRAASEMGYIYERLNQKNIPA